MINFANQNGKSLFRIDFDHADFGHIHYGLTKSELAKHRTNAVIKLFGLLRGEHNERIYFKHIL